MLYYPIRDYEEFKELFGVEKRNFGEFRKNKILLAFYKSPALLHFTRERFGCFPSVKSMADLESYVRRAASESHMDTPLPYHVVVKLEVGTFLSADYAIDACNGICQDSDITSVRYLNLKNDKTYKMSATKFFRRMLDCPVAITSLINPVVRNYVASDVIAKEWTAYANCVISKERYELHIDHYFDKIYDSQYLSGDFHSCMTDEEQYGFYSYSVNAKAAYITDALAKGKIVARAIIFREVRTNQPDCPKLNLCERQYSSDGSDDLKRLLVNMLIDAEAIDGYKKIGAGCRENRAFVLNDGTDISDWILSIDCDLNAGDTISYQDSFVAYDAAKGRLYNSCGRGHDNLLLQTTDATFDGVEYDSYHECYTTDDLEDVYVHGEPMTCSDQHLDDFALIEGHYYHEDDVFICPNCGKYFLAEEGYYSEITEEEYCSISCQEDGEDDYKSEHWTYSTFDKEYFEDDDEVIPYFDWTGTRYACVNTIHIDSARIMIDNGELLEYNGDLYMDWDKETELPFGIEVEQEIEPVYHE